MAVCACDNISVPHLLSAFVPLGLFTLLAQKFPEFFMEHRVRPLPNGLTIPMFAFFAAGVAVGGLDGLLLRRFPSLRIMDVTGPMLVQMIMPPIALVTDRMMLSHLTAGSELVQCSLGYHQFGITLQTVAAAGVVLRPVLSRNRATATVQAPWLMSVASIAGVCCWPWGSASPPPGSWATSRTGR